MTTANEDLLRTLARERAQLGRGMIRTPAAEGGIFKAPHRRREPQPAFAVAPQYAQLVTTAFSQRRKTLRNAWARVAPSALLAEAAARAGVALEARGETLDVEAFARMASALDELSR